MKRRAFTLQTRTECRLDLSISITTSSFACADPFSDQPSRPQKPLSQYITELTFRVDVPCLVPSDRFVIHTLRRLPPRINNGHYPCLTSLGITCSHTAAHSICKLGYSPFLVISSLTLLAILCRTSHRALFCLLILVA
jgi:hypothetical protein